MRVLTPMIHRDSLLSIERYQIPGSMNDTQRQPAGYEEVSDSRRSAFTTNDPKRQFAGYREVSDSRRSASTINDLQRQPAGYREISDPRKSKSDDSRSQYAGCVKFVDYSDYIPT